MLKPIKKALRNAGFVLDDFATHIDKKELSFRHPYIYTGMAIAALGVMIANKHYGFGLYQMDIESLSIEELAELISPSSLAYKELQRRNVLRTKNVVGELGEYYVIDYFNKTSSLPNLSLAPPGVQNIDALSRNGEIYSIKTISSINGTTGSFWNPESIENNEKKFDYLIIAILNKKFSLRMMLQLTWDEFFKYKKFNKRMNNYNISVTKTLISNVEVIFDSEK